MPSKTCSNNAVGFIFRTLQQRSLFFLFLPVFGPIAGALSRGWPIKIIMAFYRLHAHDGEFLVDFIMLEDPCGG